MVETSETSNVLLMRLSASVLDMMDNNTADISSLQLVICDDVIDIEPIICEKEL